MAAVSPSWETLVGLLGKAVRTASRSTRTTYRAGRSISRGRIPGASVRIGAAGFGVRVGTRGINLSSPIGSQSIGASGFRTTVGIPGIAHVAVNPLRPTLTAGAGPLRITASKNPSIGLATSLISVGVSTKPMAWLRVGDLRLALPGSTPRSTRPWSDQVDDQWRPYYQRRPPSVSAQLHDLIRTTEHEQIVAAFESVPPFVPYSLTAPDPDAAAVTADRAARRRAAVAGISLLARKKRREARTAAYADHEAWIAQRRQVMQRCIDEAIQAVLRGDDLALGAIANALLSVFGRPALITRVSARTADLVVFVPRLEDIHPSEPSFTKAGAKTVKKRSRSTRDTVHRNLMAAACLASLRVVRVPLHTAERIRVVIAVPGSGEDLGSVPVIGTFDYCGEQLPTDPHQLLHYLDDKLSSRAVLLYEVLPDAARGSANDPAIAIAASSTGDLTSPRFWIELGAAIRNLETRDSPSQPEERRRTTDAAGGALPTSAQEVHEDLATLEEIQSPVAALAHRDVIDRVLAYLVASTGDTLSDPDCTIAFMQVARCLGLLRDTSALRSCADAAERRGLSGALVRSWRAAAEAVDVASHERHLRAMLDDARDAVNSTDAALVRDLWHALIGGLTNVPEGADDEAEDVARALLEAVVVLRDAALIDRLDAAIPQCIPALQVRLEMVVDDARAMLALVEEIVHCVSEDPGCLQSRLGKRIGVDQLQCRNACWYMAQFGVLTRTKYGNSYVLHPADESDAI